MIIGKARQQPVLLDGQELESVDDVMSFGSNISVNDDWTKDVEKRIGKAASNV